MRYDDWDVILFPSSRDPQKIPIKEFKVACHVVPDHELSHINTGGGGTNSPGLMPVMTCFIPSLPVGHAFQISMHCWKTPVISQFTKTAYSKHVDLVKFEARILLDGRLVASAILGGDKDQRGPWMVASTFEFTKTGELERLRFPMFRRELLFQNHWNPNDDVGRIKVVISEGFPRDSLSVPIERVKNVVVFSFQHAPLEILEANSIAWPNPSMWRRGSVTPQLNSSAGASPMVVPTYHADDGGDSHAHSPRRKNVYLRNVKSQPGFPMGVGGSLYGQQQGQTGLFGQQSPFPQMTPSTSAAYLSRNNESGSGGNGGLFGYHAAPDPFTESAYLEWVAASIAGQSAGRNDAASLWPSMMMGQQRNHGLGRQQNSSSGDAIMTDYVCPITNMHGHYGDTMHFSADTSDDPALGRMKVPTNTPVTGPAEEYQQQMMARRDLGLGLGMGLGMGMGGLGFGASLHQANALVGEVRGGEGGLRGGEGIGMRGKFSQQQRQTAMMMESVGNGAIQDGLDHSPLSSDSGGSIQEDKSVGGGVAVSGGENVPPGGSVVYSESCSRNASAGDLSATGGVNLLSETTNTGGGGSGGGTPRLGVGERSVSGGTKRTRTFTPASARAIDEEDEPRRVSPHVRIAGFGVGGAGGGDERC
ncbi:hypothetical protein QBC44DRAFT_238239 [Cladorrhinum sp. PSN332]|nr:hypothetical protein QBC44DRAFT_238239 [Cladorrhinum sp. PSN332]